jgi:urease accessory protein
MKKHSDILGNPHLLLALSAASAFGLSVNAYGHEGEGSAGGVISGMSHPVSGLDHVVAMVAVGVWGAQLGKPAIWLLPVAFPMVMAIGGFLGLIGMPLPFVEIGIALSAIVLGSMVLAEAKPPIGVALAIVAVFAVFHGHAHGTELPENESGLLYSIGFVVCTGLLHAVGITIGIAHIWKRGRPFLRALGGAVALLGLYFLWSALT